MARSRFLILLVAAALSGCATTISGTATWPGARLEKVLLTQADFPPGVEYGRIREEPAEPDNSGGPAPMRSDPQDCSNGLTTVIAAHAERGRGSAAKYTVIYDGAQIVMTVLTSPLWLNELAAEAARCKSYNVYFDRNSAPIPMTTTKLPSPRPDQLLYQQTMRLQGVDHVTFMSFENIGRMAVFGTAAATTQMAADQQSAPKATLPQTFTDIADKQAQRIRDS